MTKVDKIVSKILEEIDAGDLREGDRIDSERALARRFSVSLVTAQRALKSLQDRGVLVREHGRGTFIKGTESKVFDAQLIRFKDESGRVLPIEAHVLGTPPIHAEIMPAAFPGWSPDMTVQILRKISVDGRFKLLSKFLMRREEFDEIEHRGVGVNIREQLAVALGLPTLRVEQEFSLISLSQSVCRDLALPWPCNGFCINFKAYTLYDKPLFQQYIYGRDFDGTTWAIDRAL